MSEPTYLPDSASVDLTNCDREPIHIPGHVQPFGCLVAVTSEWRIRNASLNVREFFAREAQDLVGQPLQELFCSKAIAEIRIRLQLLQERDAVERIFSLDLLPDDPRLFDLAIHYSDDVIVIEIERSGPPEKNDATTHVMPLIGRLQKAETIEALCTTAAKQMKALTGFDRIMVYRFAQDGSGQVISEARNGSLEAFLGLRYPASDIPRQARELYKRNLVRIISDVDAVVSPIYPMADPHGTRLDLSLSSLRAVSPIHLEYLRNMGVCASMSVSIVVRGKLWGLFACHHYEPLVLSYLIRSACELFGQLFALVLDQKEVDLTRVQSERARSLHDRLMAQLAEGSSLVDSFEMITGTLREIVPFDGAVGWIDGQFKATGMTPTRDEFLGVAKFLNTAAEGGVYATENLSAVYPAAEAFGDRAAGALALPVSRTPRDYIVLFRQEITRTVHWAGNPEKPLEVGPNGIRLTPRKSFEAWQQTVKGHSAEWTESDRHIAESLRVTLLEVVLRLTETMVGERNRAHDQQELLIAELNHRVRNILNLIRGLVNQSRGEVGSIEEFTQLVGDRIHALARAHDQLTGEKWTASSLRRLMETEAEAYLVKDFQSRLEIEGPDALLDPRAFVTLSLVIHEMMTNSMKYGALSDNRGRLNIKLLSNTDGSISLDWREIGGPAVQPPKRRGFGTTIIERSIPYDLGGEAEIHYETTGVRAHFRVPEGFVESVVDASAHMPTGLEEAEEPDVPVWNSVLVLEDNMIIALDVEDILTDIGVENVYVASNKKEARRLADNHDIELFILDVNLGEETSEDFAELLASRGKPFIFATGYGESEALTAAFPQAAVLQKPFDAGALRRAFAKVSGDTMGNA